MVASKDSRCAYRAGDNKGKLYLIQVNDSNTTGFQYDRNLQKAVLEVSLVGENPMSRRNLGAKLRGNTNLQSGVTQDQND